MDKILSPVLQTIRKNKINSFLQLKNFNKSAQVKSSVFQQNRFSHSKTLQIASMMQQKRIPLLKYKNNKNKVVSLNQKREQSNPQYSNNFITFFPNNQNSNVYQQKGHQTAEQKTSKNNDSILQMRHVPQTAPTISNIKKSVRVNSKVKRHLVEEVNLEQVQQKLYKKRQYLTRYEYFMEVMEAKNRNKIKQYQKFKTTSKGIFNTISNLEKQQRKNILNQKNQVSKQKNQLNKIFIKPTTKKSSKKYILDIKNLQQSQCSYDNKPFKSPRKKFWFNYNTYSFKKEHNTSMDKKRYQRGYNNSNILANKSATISLTKRTSPKNYNQSYINMSSRRQQSISMTGRKTQNFNNLAQEDIKFIQGRSIKKIIV